MPAALTPVISPATVFKAPTLKRLSEAEFAKATVAWAAAERLIGAVTELSGLLSRIYGPARLERRATPAALATRYL